MELLTWPLAALLALLVILFITPFYFLISRGNKRIPTKNLPPQAAGGWPIIGHLRLLSGPDLPHINLSDMADKCGPIFRIRLGVRKALIVSTWEIAKECFTTNDMTFSDRPRTTAIKHMSYDFAMFGMGKYGPYWRELRKVCVQKLLSNRKVETLGHLYVAEIKAMMRSLYYNSCGGGDKAATSPLEMRKFFEDLSLKVMVRVVAGNVNKGSEEMNQRLHETLIEFLRAMVAETILDVLPYLKWLDWFGGISRPFKNTGKEFDRLVQGWLEQHKKHRRTNSDRDESFMAEMMRVADEIAGEFPRYDADTIIKATCQNMMLGGSDTTAVTLTWALCLLLNNQHILKKAQEELDNHIGKERLVEESDLENLPYIQAILKETMRLQPATPILPVRESMADCTIAGYHIPTGTLLMVNAWKFHRDPQIWDDPLEFRPERFLLENKEVDVRGLHYVLLPFGAGRRICPGISFGLRVMEFALASLLHGFEIEKFSTETIDMIGSIGVTNKKATPLNVLLKPRLSSDLYA